MKLTNEQIEQILERAPQGAIEYCLYGYGDATHPLFLNCENQFYEPDEREWIDIKSIDNYFHSRTRLADLREILTLRQKLHHMAQTDRAVYRRASELSERIEAQKETIFNIRQRVQEFKNLTQAVVVAWSCGDDDDLQRACGAIVDYTKKHKFDEDEALTLYHQQGGDL